MRNYDSEDDQLAYERVMSFVDQPVRLSQQEGVIIPPVLYLPVIVNGRGRAAADIRMKEDGKRALIAFTALDRLAAQYGINQSWVLMPVESLGGVKAEQSFDVIAFDPIIASSLDGNGTRN